jgi:hypothetical protein
MLVSHRHQFIYTKTHKTAGTSVEGYFERFCLPPDQDFIIQHQRDAYESVHGIVGCRGMPAKNQAIWWNHMPALQIKQKLGDDIWNRYFKFCVVRNPYEIIISHFFFQSRKNSKPDHELFKLTPDELRNRFRIWLETANLPNDCERYMIDGVICINDFIRYENLHADIERICHKLDIEYSPDLLPTFKAEFRPAHATADTLYTKETKEIVEKRYAFDLDYFGYGFPSGENKSARDHFVPNSNEDVRKPHPDPPVETTSASDGIAPQELLLQIYRGLLGREADPDGLAHYSKVVAEPDGVVTCLRSMVGSTEFANRFNITKKYLGFEKIDLEKEKIVFLHLPKTGGTTLHHLLLEGRSDEEICPERHNGLHTFTAGELARYRVFSGHFDYVSTHLIPGRKALITMLRNPIDRLVSLYHFQKAHRQEVIDRDGLYLARVANSHSMAEFFQLEEIRSHPSIHNAMTRMLSDRVNRLRWEKYHENRTPALVTPDLESAFEALENMRAFGLLESYEESIEWIFQSLGISVPDVIPQNMVLDKIVNTDPGLQPIQKEPLTDELRELMQDLVAYDLKLYTRAKELFSRSCTRN